MKKIIITLLALTSISLSFARGPMGDKQGGPPPIPNEEQLEMMIDSMSAELDLTEAQSEQLFTLFQKHFEEIESKMESRPPREEMEKLRTEFENKVAAVLGEEKAKLYRETMRSNGPRGKGRR